LLMLLNPEWLRRLPGLATVTARATLTRPNKGD
jgi:hypothetical protein